MKILATLLCLTCALTALAADSTINNLGPITTVPDTYVMPWENPGVIDYHITYQNLTNQILNGYAGQAYANNAAQFATNDLSGVLKARMDSGTNDLSGVLKTYTQNATNDLNTLAKTYTNAAGIVQIVTNYNSGTLPVNITGNSMTSVSATNVVGGTVSATSYTGTGLMTQSNAVLITSGTGGANGTIGGNGTNSLEVDSAYKTKAFQVGTNGNAFFGGSTYFGGGTTYYFDSGGNIYCQKVSPQNDLVGSGDIFAGVNYRIGINTRCRFAYPSTTLMQLLDAVNLNNATLTLSNIVAAGAITLTNSSGTNWLMGKSRIDTNISPVSVTANWYGTTLAANITNIQQRAIVKLVMAFNDVATGTPQATVTITDNGTTNAYPYTIIGGIVASITNSLNIGVIGPGAIVNVTDTSYGTGASVSVVTSTWKGM
jgi:hypothetical protein